MSQNQGFAHLNTTRDLLDKLVHDQSRMRSNPNDFYAAFDFFVTAEHMVDWYLPDCEIGSQTKARKALRDSTPLLALVSHIANGAKHFEATAKHHKSVDDVRAHEGGFSPSAFSSSAFSPAAFQFAGITIKLSDGSARHVFDIADEVISYWQRELGV